MKKIIVAIGLMTLLVNAAHAAEKLPVYVSIVPQKYFVQQIGGERVEIHVMVPPGASPATYEPKPRQMGQLSKTRLYFAIGVPFENAWLHKIRAASAAMTIVYTQQGIERMPMATHARHEPRHHAEDSAHRHAHPHPGNGLDPHIWLSPPLVKQQARTILAALQTADPDNATWYQSHCDAFLGRIDALHTHLSGVFAAKAGLRFMVFHPSWGYFARAYGIEQIPIEIEGKEPKPAQLAGLIEHARKKGISIVFVQPQFSTKSAALVARAIGGGVAVADPLAEQWEHNLRQVADQFDAALN